MMPGLCAETSGGPSAFHVRQVIRCPRGDEFLIIASGIHVPECRTDCRKVIGVVSQPINYNGGQAVVGSDIRIALCPNDGQDMDQLIKKADDAMYKIKKTGKNGYCFINPQ